MNLLKKNSLDFQKKTIEELNKKSQIVEAWFHNLNLLLEYLLDESSATFNPQKALKIINTIDSHQYHGNREEVARKTTDASGHVSFSGLQYGTYRVSETKVPTGYDGSEDFYVTISEHGQTFHYVIENKVKEAKVRFVKVDEETGKEIVRSKAGFEIYSETTGEQLKMKDLDGVEHSVFYTNEEGILQLPTQFAFGEYKAVEVEAPEGYVLADEPAC